MKPKTLMLLCVAVGCGLVAMIGVQQALNKPKTAEVQTIQVAVALADINPGEPLNEKDPILNAIRDAEARARCIARLAPTEKGPENALVYEYQLVVRGRKGTPQLP